MTRNRIPMTRVCASGALLFSLCVSATAVAKLTVPYGPDGAPPDSETQAEVDALNEALEPPEEGQSWQSWEAEWEAAYYDLHGAYPTSTPTPVSESMVQVSSRDICEDDLGLWVPNTAGGSVASELHESGVRAAITAELQRMLNWILRMETAGTQLEFDEPVVSGFACEQCEMTYLECLQAGNPWDFCKRRHLNCPASPSSTLSVSVAVTSPVTGRITANATASSEVWSSAGEEYPNFCFTLQNYEFEGFSFVTQAIIEANIDNVLGDGHFCLYDFSL